MADCAMVTGSERSAVARAARMVERISATVTAVFLPAIVFLFVWFTSYIVVGFTLKQMGWTPPYQFLSLTSDPVFSILSTVFGATVCAGSGSLIVLWTLYEPTDRSSIMSLLASFTGLGLGGAILRHTAPLTVDLLAQFFS